MLLTELPQNFVLANVIKKDCYLLLKRFPVPVRGPVLRGTKPAIPGAARNSGWPGPKTPVLVGSPCTVKIQRGSLSFLALTQPICFKRVETSQRSPGWHSLGASGFAPGLVEGQQGLKVACSCHCILV